MSNLPAGQFITTISGKQCTARPQTRTSAALASASAASQAAASSSEAVAQASSASQASIDLQSAQSQAQASAAAATSTTQAQETTTPQATFAGAINSRTPQAAAASTSTQVAISTTPDLSTATNSDFESAAASSSTIAAVPSAAESSNQAISTTLTPEATSEATSEATTPITLSLTSIPTPQSVATVPLSFSYTSFTIHNGHSAAAHSTASSSVHPGESSAASGISSTQATTKTNLMPMVGGVVGSVALIGILGVIFWLFNRRRKARRDSFLTPLTTNDEKGYYGQDSDSLKSTKGLWRTKIGLPKTELGGVKAGVIRLGSSLMAKLLPNRNSTPNVNLNRGNSQFMDGAIPQHSRSNSTTSHTSRLTPTDRFHDWWASFTDDLAFKLHLRKQRRESVDPFAAARSITRKESVANTTTPDFSQLLSMKDNELQLDAERRRTLLNSGSLGLNFSSQNLDPFSDPIPRAQQWTPPKPTMNSTSNNPFIDPITQPEATMSRTQTVIPDIRRSRGQSIDLASTSNNASAYAATAYSRPPSIAVTSRYPSTMAPSRDSYRDTIFSTSTRKGKGRSDPFDLERHEFWKSPPPAMPALPTNANQTLGGFSNITDLRSSAMPDALSMPGYKPPEPQRVESSMTASSKYSSGVSDLSGWGDPGPDVGSPTSSNSYLQKRSGSPVSDISSRLGVEKAR